MSILDQIAFDQIADERDKAQQENKLLKQRIKRLEESLTSIAEYWNRDNNEQAMEDACWRTINTATEALEDKP